MRKQRQFKPSGAKWGVRMMGQGWMQWREKLRSLQGTGLILYGYFLPELCGFDGLYV